MLLSFGVLSLKRETLTEEPRQRGRNALTSVFYCPKGLEGLTLIPLGGAIGEIRSVCLKIGEVVENGKEKGIRALVQEAPINTGQR